MSREGDNLTHVSTVSLYREQKRLKERVRELEKKLDKLDEEGSADA